jgi:hypothetical protein
MKLPRTFITLLLLGYFYAGSSSAHAAVRLVLVFGNTKIAAESQGRRQARTAGPTHRYGICRRVRVFGCNWMRC